jgi:cholest-4-en-3-one 26-monooxygenase
MAPDVTVGTRTRSIEGGAAVQLGDVDLYDPDTFVPGVPHEYFALLRREAPVFQHPYPYGGHFWCVTRHEDLVAVNRDNSTYSSWQRTALIDTPPEDGLEMARMLMLNMDPPDHTQLRKIVNKGFTPKMIRSLMEHLRSEAKEIVERARDKGEVDFVEEVAAELPLIAIAEFLGVPVEDRKVIFDLSNRLVGNADPEYGLTEAMAQDAATEMFGYAQELAAHKRQHPGDDIASTLLQAEVDGDRLSDMDFNVFFMLLSVAGNETTRNAISHGMLALLEHPDQRQDLIEHPDILESAVEEILRWASPVMQFKRTTTKPVRVGDVELGEDESIVFWHISANRDEAVFADPYTFDLRRAPNAHTSSHIAFGGGGPHFCLGAQLARLEIRMLFEELATRYPRIEALGEPDRLRSNFIGGIKHLPVRLHAPS